MPLYRKRSRRNRDAPIREAQTIVMPGQAGMPVAFKYYVYCTFSEWSTYCLLCERRIICAREPRIYLLARSQAHRTRRVCGRSRRGQVFL